MSSTNEHFLSDLISKMNTIKGINTVYFLDENKKPIKEFHYNETENYSNQIQELLHLEPLLNSVGSNLFQSELHTNYFLNEDGLIIISKVGSNLYMIIIAGENEPADLMNLLKICKESRINYKMVSQ